MSLPWLGESVLSCDFPARSGKQLFLLKTQEKVTKAVVLWWEIWTRVLAFLSSLRLVTIKLLQGKNTSFAIDPKTRIHKSMFPCISELCKDTPRMHKISREKRSGRVFCECWLPHPLLPWLTETVFSNDFSARSGKKPVSLVKLKYLIKTVVEVKRKINQCVFLKVWGGNYPAFTGGKYCFWNHASNPMFKETGFLQFQSV